MQRLQLERRLRSCAPEVATVNSLLELTVGSSSKEKPTVTSGRPPLRLADFQPRRRRGHPLRGEARKKRGSARLALQPANPDGGRFFHRDAGWAAWPTIIRIILLAARQEPTPLEKPQGWTPMSARPSAVEEPLTTPCAWSSSCAKWEARSKRRGTPCGCPEVGPADGEARHEACPYVVIELRKV